MNYSLSKVFLAKTAIVIAVSGVLSANATVLTQSKIDWGTGLTPEKGGVATVHWDSDGDGGLESDFQINVAPFELSMRIPNYSTLGWLTPVVGSGVSFDPVTLYSIYGAYKDVFLTSMGLGFRNPTAEVWDGGNLMFLDYFQWWDVEFTRPDARLSLMAFDSPGSNPTGWEDVPEPATSMLFGFALCLAWAITKITHSGQKAE